VPLLPVVERGEGGEGGQEIRGDGERDDEGEGAGEGAAGILDLFGDGGELLVAGVEPDAEGESHAEDLEEGFVRGNHRNEGIVLPLREAHHGHDGDGQEDENLEQGGNAADHLDAAHVDVGDAGDERGGYEVMIASGESREIEAEVVGEEDGVGAAEGKRSGPVPPARKEAPEIAEGGAHPAIEAALHGHGGSELGSDQRDRDEPEERNEQMKEQGHAGTGAADLLFEAEGAAGGVGVHDEDEVEKGGFAYCGLRRTWVRSHCELSRQQSTFVGAPPPPFFHKCSF